MLGIPRSLARQVRAIFRRTLPKADAHHARIVLQAGADGLRLRLHHPDVAAQYHQPDAYTPEVLLLPLEAFARFEGRSDSPVTLERTDQGTIVAQWQDGIVPQVAEYEAGDPEKVTQFPDLPEETLPNEPGFWKALSDATQSAARQGQRCALDHLQLRGRTGSVVATDGRQLLLQSGFRFPWPEDVLIPSSPVFGCPELPRDTPVAVGRTATHICMQAAAWLLFFRIDPDGRYPTAEQAIPSLTGTHTRWRLDPADAVFLAQALPRLPGSDEENAPVTVDLNGHAVVRARTPGQSRATEVLLARSAVSDPPVRFCINRQLLARAVQLGFADIAVVHPDSPLVCQDTRRQFVIMPLGQDLALPPREDVVRIPSSQDGTGSKHATCSKRKLSRRTPTGASTTNGNGLHAPTTPPLALPEKPNGTGLAALLVEAEALRVLLRDASTRSSQLLLAIKRQKKQAHAVRATLASLRQLQHLDA